MWHNYSMKFLFYSIIFFATFPIFSQTELDLESIFVETIDYNNNYGGGTILVTSESSGELFYMNYGHISNGSSNKINDSTLYEIASISKTFTAVVILQLAEKELLYFDDKISNYLDEEIYMELLVIDDIDLSGEITISQLLNHTSGLGDYWFDPPYDKKGFNPFLQEFIKNEDRFWEPREILEYARQIDVIGSPGEIFNYSDTNYLLLGMIIEKITDQELHSVYNEYIFAPLGMKNSWMIYHEPATSISRLSHRYENDYDLYNKLNLTADWAGGGLVSCNEDLTKFLFALANAVIVSESSLNLMKQWTETGVIDVEYGLGIYHLILDDGLGELWGHDGHGNSFMYYWPQEKIYIVGTLNQTENDWWPIIEELITQVKY